MTSEEMAFLEAIRAAPEDDTIRLAYADWLEKRGDPLGEFIRFHAAAHNSGVVALLRQPRFKELFINYRDQWCPRFPGKLSAGCWVQRHGVLPFFKGLPVMEIAAYAPDLLPNADTILDWLSPRCLVKLELFIYASECDLSAVLDHPLVRRSTWLGLTEAIGTQVDSGTKMERVTVQQLVTIASHPVLRQFARVELDFTEPTRAAAEGMFGPPVKSLFVKRTCG